MGGGWRKVGGGREGGGPLNQKKYPSITIYLEKKVIGAERGRGLGSWGSKLSFWYSTMGSRMKNRMRSTTRGQGCLAKLSKSVEMCVSGNEDRGRWDMRLDPLEFGGGVDPPSLWSFLGVTIKFANFGRRTGWQGRPLPFRPANGPKIGDFTAACMMGCNILIPL